MIVFLNTVTNRDWMWKLKPEDEAQPCMIQYTAIVVSPHGERRYFGNTYAMEAHETIAQSALDRLQVPSSQTFLDMALPRLDIGDAMDLSAILSSATLLVAHSAAFHRKVLERVAFLHGIHTEITAPWFCTMLEATNICQIPPPTGRGKSKWPTLWEAWEHFWPGQAPQIPNNLPDAMSDVTKAGFLAPSMVLDVYGAILRHRQQGMPAGLG